MAGIDDRNQQQQTGNSASSGNTRDWSTERTWWQDNYRSRPYATADRGFEFYEPGYRYGTESASRHKGRKWDDVEGDLRRDWDDHEYRGSNKSTWEEVKSSVRDAWDRMTGDDNRNEAR